MKYQVVEVVTLRQFEAIERDKSVDLSIYQKPFINELKRLSGHRVEIIRLENTGYKINESMFTIIDSVIAHNFTYGEEIEVRNHDYREWEKALFIGFNDGDNYRYHVVQGENKYSFIHGDSFYTSKYVYARKLQKPKLEIKLFLGEKEITNCLNEETKDNIRKEIL